MKSVCTSLEELMRTRPVKPQDSGTDIAKCLKKQKDNRYAACADVCTHQEFAASGV